MPHYLGLAGELLNLLGALVMGLDVFWRDRERKLKSDLEHVKKLALNANIPSTLYKGCEVVSEDFPESALDKRSSLIAYTGAGLLALGFVLLAVYHGLEIWG